ncbi:MAG: competence/damage-inducible protein A [Alphaproteobacteria bacterium]|jgi:molybdenum cofactor synthesis domain-containing protein|nr:competence/damage-inducible protein A [Alphaproteobacteria bacterium]MBU2042077.1 competence/damage-inducible protein A [Alphaproteobacteria bacterium]MBU2124488.1 competence/damage-inducible protein A [Alphaproteobacteria bacterium]MBU2292410.1 competence/damage-inducible protein A [Alphaproteobacteria bacterium]MBU2396937.1 competence/damage-inducible protein A [Alphaproteobacteria bacterium]
MTESSPTAAVLIIGDEVLSGRTQDTNLNTIARFLAALGIDLMEARTVGDRKAQIVDSLNALRAGHDYVFTTGGIGPTHDDITADAVATALGVALPEHPEALAILARRYGDDFNVARRRMARIPQGGTLIANPVTDAPGFQIGNVFVLAGVPKIMTAMLEDVAPRLRTGAVVHARTIRVTGVGEGDVAEMLTAAARAERQVSFGSYPFGHGSVGEMGTHLVVRGRDVAKVEASVEALLASLGAAGVAATAAP